MKTMKCLIAFIGIVFVSLWMLVPYATAVGTLAGTEISNKATATYTIGTVPGLTKDSNVYTIKVDEIINVDVTWQDASEVVVTPGATNQSLTFLLTNTGNGTEGFTLSALSTITGDDFDPTLVDMYFDDNENGVYDPGETQYEPGVNDPMLAADANIVVFVLNDIPLDPNDGDQGYSRLKATSKTGTGPAGTIFEGAGDEGTDAVIGTSTGSDQVIGIYIVSGVVVIMNKSALIEDPFNGEKPVPGATITYSVVVTVTGSGTAKDVIVEDTIPTGTTYIGNSLTLNTTSLTDAQDADAGDVGGTKPNTVTVDLGDLSSASPAKTISFKVTID